MVALIAGTVLQSIMLGLVVVCTAQCRVRMLIFWSHYTPGEPLPYITDRLLWTGPLQPVSSLAGGIVVAATFCMLGVVLVLSRRVRLPCMRSLPDLGIRVGCRFVLCCGAGICVPAPVSAGSGEV
jgi:hypothetical protein